MLQNQYQACLYLFDMDAADEEDSLYEDKSLLDVSNLSLEDQELMTTTGK